MTDISPINVNPRKTFCNRLHCSHLPNTQNINSPRIEFQVVPVCLYILSFLLFNLHFYTLFWELFFFTRKIQKYYFRENLFWSCSFKILYFNAVFCSVFSTQFSKAGALTQKRIGISFHQQKAVSIYILASNSYYTIFNRRNVELLMWNLSTYIYQSWNVAFLEQKILKFDKIIITR